MAELSAKVKVIVGVAGVDCPYCAADRVVGHLAECVHFMVPYVAQAPGGKFYAMVNPQDGGKHFKQGPFDTFDEAASAANAGVATFSAKIGGVVRCHVPTQADGGKLMEAVKHA